MTHTTSGMDAFWAERVKKEVKTYMRHNEDHQIVDRDSLERLYQVMSKGTDS